MKKGYDPTHPFTIFESLIPGKLYIDWKCRSTDFEVRKLWKGQSGRGQRRCTIPAHSSSGNGRRSCERRSDSFLITFFSAYSCFLIFFFLLLFAPPSSSFFLFLHLLFFFFFFSFHFSQFYRWLPFFFFPGQKIASRAVSNCYHHLQREERTEEKHSKKLSKNFWNMFFFTVPLSFWKSLIFIYFIIITSEQQ